ncbi:hypothetical protein CPB84DRAFT_1776394 [Gymnopilus junonius]|uniref:DUF6533 domain-containing protein n=1 Tax=Gymnopilus junonius TaxID=109634 RepID=A0A9P5NPP0_GYMJU|nr:hypothetical protein CPB84DRAFT_1776394 [Gymnopilus junonius]
MQHSFPNSYEEIIKQLNQVETARNARLASLAIVFYDYLITFDREVDLIWKSEWYFPKVIFLMNRYYAIASAIFSYYIFFGSQLSSKLCLHYYLWEGWTGLIACMLAETILQMRIYGLYRQDKFIVRLMVFLFIACSTAAAITMGISLRGVKTFPIDIPNGQFCFGIALPHLFAFWIPVLSFEIFLCSLALLHGYEYYRSENRSLLSFGTFYQNRLSDIIVRDSIIYFFTIGAVYLTCLIVWIINQNALVEAPAGFSIALSSVLGSRLILNLREAHVQHPTRFSSTVGTSIIVIDTPYSE